MPVRVERQNRVLTVIHSRPEVRNAVDPEHADALHQVFLALDSDEQANVAVLWGEGGAFCAGADLKSLARRGIATAENMSTHKSLEFPTDDSPVPRGPMGPSGNGPIAAASSKQKVPLALHASRKALGDMVSPGDRRPRTSFQMVESAGCLVSLTESMVDRARYSQRMNTAKWPFNKIERCGSI